MRRVRVALLSAFLLAAPVQQAAAVEHTGKKVITLRADDTKDCVRLWLHGITAVTVTVQSIDFFRRS